MNASTLWIIPVLPLLAAALISLMPRGWRVPAAFLAIATMVVAFVRSLIALLAALQLPHGGEGVVFHDYFNFPWFELGRRTLDLGFVLDPLTAVMLVMVTFVGTLIFIFSIGYMREDENFTRFFCFLSFFASAMLGIIVSNSLLLVFISWELVGLASYLLIGFWYHKPSAASAAKKAFLVTRVGDIAFLLGMVWLYHETGTLLFYNDGKGCLEQGAISLMASKGVFGYIAVSTAISILIFIGAAGKSGQFPLHVWLPDAMEGPTPVSALIHAATMVAAGVFLVARVYPIFMADVLIQTTAVHALTLVTWVGAFTALYASVIAVAQFDIKRILAYSTVSQLGYMMMALGVGGYSAGVFHLITHAFFKALLFLGAGSVIYACHHEQDIRKLGGLSVKMRTTFATFAIGMMALSGFPLLFSGFWSKDAILHAVLTSPLHVPKVIFFMGATGAVLTAFYMTRLMCYVFFGEKRTIELHGHEVHENSPVMTLPLVLLAIGAVVLGFIGTPLWPWFQDFVTGKQAHFGFVELLEPSTLIVMTVSVLAVAFGVGLAISLYGSKPISRVTDPDKLEGILRGAYHDIHNAFWMNEVYRATLIRGGYLIGKFADAFDRYIIAGIVWLVTRIATGLAYLQQTSDESCVNEIFDRGCLAFKSGAEKLSQFQNGQTHRYMKVIGIATTILILILILGGLL